MFDLKSWQKQLEQNLVQDIEKSQIWHHQIKPVVSELLPMLTAMEQQLEQQAKSRNVSQQYDIVCSASEPQSMCTGFSSMLRADVRKQLAMKGPHDTITMTAYAQNEKVNVLNRPRRFQLHGAICYGDEVLLQQQEVQAIVHSGQEQCLVTGKYVQHRAALEEIEQLIEQAKRIGETIPFIVDFYAARFYVLQLEFPQTEEVKNWQKIDRVQVTPFAPDIEEQVKLTLYEEPIWNLEMVALKQRLSKRKLLPNGLHRREFEDAKRRKLLPIIPKGGIFCSLVEEASTNHYVVTAELPAEENTLLAYVMQPIAEEGPQLHNQATMVLPTFAKEPTIADLHALTTAFSFLQPLTIEFAKLELLPVQPGDLWRRDCLVLAVRCAEDDYTASRLRALEQCVLSYFSYAACRVERVGDVDAK